MLEVRAMLTKKRIAEIAAETKKVCSPNGRGHGLSLFADGSTRVAVSCNDVVARSSGSGGREYRVAYLTRPMSRNEVREVCLEAIA